MELAELAYLGEAIYYADKARSLDQAVHTFEHLADDVQKYYGYAKNYFSRKRKSQEKLEKAGKKVSVLTGIQTNGSSNSHYRNIPRVMSYRRRYKKSYKHTKKRKYSMKKKGKKSFRKNKAYPKYSNKKSKTYQAGKGIRVGRKFVRKVREAINEDTPSGHYFYNSATAASCTVQNRQCSMGVGFKEINDIKAAAGKLFGNTASTSNNIIQLEHSSMHMMFKNATLDDAHVTIYKFIPTVATLLANEGPVAVMNDILDKSNVSGSTAPVFTADGSGGSFLGLTPNDCPGLRRKWKPIPIKSFIAKPGQIDEFIVSDTTSHRIYFGPGDSEVGETAVPKYRKNLSEFYFYVIKPAPIYVNGATTEGVVVPKTLVTADLDKGLFLLTWNTRYKIRIPAAIGNNQNIQQPVSYDNFINTIASGVGKIVEYFDPAKPEGIIT